MKPSVTTNESTKERLRELFGEIGLEKRQLADLLGTAFSTITKYLDANERATIPTSFIEKVAEKIPVNFQWLFTGEGSKYIGDFDPSDLNIEEKPHHVLSAEKRGVDVGICQRIIKIRKEGDLSQENFAKTIGVERHTQASIENYRQNPTTHYMNGLAFKYKINLNWLIAGIGNKFLGDNSGGGNDSDLINTIREKDIFIKQLLEIINKK